MQKKALLRRHLRTLRVDGILITDLTNLRYLTGFTGSSGFAVITTRHALFVTDFRYQEQSGQEVRGFTIKIEHTERSREISAICRAFGIRRLGVEGHNITVEFYGRLGKQGIRIKPLPNIVQSLRIIKTPAELASIATSVRRAETAFRKLIPAIRRGTTEQKLALKFEELLKHCGCKKLPFEVIVASGPTAALPHARPTGRKLREGDLVIFDWGGECDGYFSDMTRTVLLRGKDIARQREIYDHVLEAQGRAIEKVRAGAKASDVDGAARKYIRDAGYDEYFGHGTGHGVGLAVHEKPVVSWRSREVIRENMVFTVEPGIYIPGFGGVRIEDMVVARKNGTRLLTSLSRKLKIIEV